MAKRLTPEEKAARDQQRKLDKLAKREAELAARRAQWEVERQQAKASFELALTEKEKVAIAAVLGPTGHEQDPYKPDGQLRPVFANAFIGSLALQLANKGSLSPSQLSCVVREYDRKLEIARQGAAWPNIAEGDHVMALCTVLSIEKINLGIGAHPHALSGYCKIKMKSHYGRMFHLNTAARRFLDVAEMAMKEGIRVNVQGTARWISPDARIVVLDKKDLYFRPL